jgi:hypothetical protein
METSIMSKAEQMRHHIRACTLSDKTVGSYCTEHGLSIATYYYWHQKLKEVKQPSGFIELASSASGSCIEVLLPNGIRIYFDQLVPVSYLKEIVCFI